MRLLLMLVGAIVLLMVLAFVISTLKWLLILAAVLVGVGLLVGWRPGKTSTHQQQ